VAAQLLPAEPRFEGGYGDSRRFGGIPQALIIGKVKLVILGINAQHQIVESSYLKPVQ